MSKLPSPDGRLLSGVLLIVVVVLLAIAATSLFGCTAEQRTSLTQERIERFHDDSLRVTCWRIRHTSGGISCIPDAQLAPADGTVVR